MNYMFSTSNLSNFEMQKNFETAKLRILQYNCNRSTNVMQTILDYAVKNADIVLLQESWIENNNISISHPAFMKVAWTEKNVKARIMTFISKKANLNLNCTPRYDISNDSDIQMLEITSNIEDFMIFNIYNEKSQDENQEYTIERKLTSIDIFEKAIICEDFNAHVTLFMMKFEDSKFDSNKCISFMN